jgi:hypothetical protein
MLPNIAEFFYTYIPLTLDLDHAYREIPTFYKNDLAIINTADVTGGKWPIADSHRRL